MCLKKSASSDPDTQEGSTGPLDQSEGCDDALVSGTGAAPSAQSMRPARGASPELHRVQSMPGVDIDPAQYEEILRHAWLFDVLCDLQRYAVRHGLYPFAVGIENAAEVLLQSIEPETRGEEIPGETE